MGAIGLSWLIIAFPLAGLAVNALVGPRLPRRAVGGVGSAAVLLSFLWSWLVFQQLNAGPPERLFVETFYTWVPVGELQIDFAVRIDPLSAVMALVVSGVGLLIHVYSIGYMAGDPRFSRYFAYLNLFVASMLTLVLGENFFVLFVGWELVGLSSYLLIGFWFDRESAHRAGKKAFITTRVGDLGFLLGVFLVWAAFRTLDFSRVFEAAGATDAGVVTAIALLLLAGAVGKSAQIPLHVWLPDAMEGPTPVSALIHAATMVTAGVYMVARLHPLFEQAPLAAGVVAVIGAVTALFAATIALVQRDIKRVLAYSTISQLGYMFLAVGVGAYVAGIFHLVTHAFFKALLFLGAGSVMHALHEETDVFKMGGLRRPLRTTFLVWAAGWLALSGIPPFAGFWSKDEILTEALHGGEGLLWLLGLVTAGLTAFYVSRITFLTFFGEPRWAGTAGRGGGTAGRAAGSGGQGAGSGDQGQPRESPPVMIWPMALLAVGSLVAGFLLGFPPGAGSPLHRYLGPVFEAGGAAAFDPFSAGLSLALAAAGLWLAWAMYGSRQVDPERLSRRFRPVYRVLWNKYYVDELYGWLFVRSYEGLARWWDRSFDAGGIDRLANEVGRAVAGLASSGRRWQSGYVRNYALSILVGVLILVAYFSLA